MRDSAFCEKDVLDLLGFTLITGVTLTGLDGIAARSGDW